jgi:hypothetical protein
MYQQLVGFEVLAALDSTIVTANIVPSTRILSSLKLKGKCSSKIPVLRSPSRCHISADSILMLYIFGLRVLRNAVLNLWVTKYVGKVLST